ncbi:hypothetical protein SNE40_013696 [Patella caerulea]|uniref:G-protein coupled receptors family 2 profile 2 domain-containing protein n=1 Tax=Patella caerulea TaxID=87958 RepID=A0AAN8JDZ8_PATCE
MYFHITVLVVASAFPLVRILDRVGEDTQKDAGDRRVLQERYVRSAHSDDKGDPTSRAVAERQRDTLQNSKADHVFMGHSVRPSRSNRRKAHKSRIRSRLRKDGRGNMRSFQQQYLRSTRSNSRPDHLSMSRNGIEQLTMRTLDGFILEHTSYKSYKSQHFLENRILRHRLRHQSYSEAEATNKAPVMYDGLEEVIRVQRGPVNYSNKFVENDEDDENGASDLDIDLGRSKGNGCHRVEGYEHNWVTTVNTCATSWFADDIRALCISQFYSQMTLNRFDIDMLPVQTANGTVYKNRYCAICNYDFKHKHWKMEIQCDQPTNVVFLSGARSINILEKFHNSSLCSVRVTPPYNDYRIESCKPRSKRNGRETRGAFPPAGNDAYPISFSVLMNFGFDGKTHIMFSSTEVNKVQATTKQCEEGQILDPGTNLCRRVTCSLGFILKDETCVRTNMTDTYSDSDINNIANITSLTNLNSIAVISLEVNVTYDDLGLALYALEFKPLMVKKIAKLLNISSDRIQNFTIEFVNQSESSGHHIRVQTMTQEEFQSQDSKSGSDGDILQVVTQYKDSESDPDMDTFDENDDPQSDQYEGIRPENNYDHLQSNITVDDFGTKNVNESDFINKTATERPPGKNITNDIHEKVPETTNQWELTNAKPNRVTDIPESTLTHDKSTAASRRLSANFMHPKKHNKTADHKILNPQVLRMAFILLPTRKESTESISEVIKKMNSMLNQNTFKIDMNGTTFHIVNVNDKVAAEEKTFCKFGTKDIFYDNEFQVWKVNGTDENSTTTKVYIPSTHTIYNPGEYDMTVLVQGSLGTETNVTDVAGYVFVCIKPRIVTRNCARITILQEEYTLFKNKSIMFYNEIYSMTQYAVLDETAGTLVICVPDEYYNTEKQQQTKHWIVQECYHGYEDFIKTEGYLTIVIGRLSIIALSSVLLTYVLFKSLRNLPGINTMNLTLALLIGEILFIEGESTGVPWVCKFVAVSVHYFFLASFFWMNVMAYDVSKTFANKCILTRIRNTRKFIPRYALYAWGSPAAIVAICLIFEFNGMTDKLHIGYGESTLVDVTYDNVTRPPDGVATNNSHVQHSSHSVGCWIQSPVAALVAFGAPVLTLLVINIFFFVRTIICIQATAKLAHINTRRTFSHMTGRNDVMLYVRMSTVMGFTWCFGIASSIVSGLFTPPDRTVCLSLHILSILYTICMCAQGLFIFFAFVFKKRVYYLYRGLFRKIKLSFERRRSTKSPSSSSTSVNSNFTNISHISR